MGDPFFTVDQLEEVWRPLDERRGVLLGKFNPFADELLTAISDFIEEALRRGVGDASRAKDKSSSGVRRLEFGFLGKSWVVAGDQTCLPFRGTDHLRARVMVFADDPSAHAVLSAEVIEGDPAQWQLLFLTGGTDGDWQIVDQGELQDGSGRRASEWIFRQLTTGFRRHWINRPTLQGLETGDIVEVRGFGGDA